MPKVTVNGKRLMERHQAMATFGATGKGGVCRPALSDAETAARAELLGWARSRGFACMIDPIGNIFIRRPGLRKDLPPIRLGSHLDSQMPGGNYDGVYGVLAGFEVLESLEDAGVKTNAPVEVVAWNNEEGCRFQPTTMGSAVHAGALPLDQALAVTDIDGISVGQALTQSLAALGPLTPLSLGTASALYLEAHIEQGALLEATGIPLGVVTDIQGIAQFRVTVQGEIAHAGTTPRYLRKDALQFAMQLIDELSERMHKYDDRVRFTVGSMKVWPGAINTVPGEVVFTIDLRHPDTETLGYLSQMISDICATKFSDCSATLESLLSSPPVRFNKQVIEIIRQAAQSLAEVNDIVSGATHDAKYLAATCPTGMIFIPCHRGISHNEKEFAEPAHMVLGAEAMLQTVLLHVATAAVPA